ncbi:MAG: TIM barrel protein [Candidatus Latescibacteria bacterium]|jgi:sugar phosphate isomerase/epimerase|nr:TIM barrel protein [Candidatus Latescibacterota bacterium]MBT4141039.1 TIM barrel protein [Candidatus Latescibacterota bacterium]MBT5832596.1 TIM barrel protein [Candidatus Latescibacterota bacterium]
MSNLSVSTWSLHRQLGRAWYVPTEEGLQDRSEPTDRVELMAVPGLVASHGIHQLEVCHFHFPSVDVGYLREFRSELDQHNVTFYSLLIDTGDITHPDEVQREEELNLIRGWIDVAGICGAKQARVVAGEADESDNAIALSAKNLGVLAEYAQGKGVRVSTENFKKLTQRAAPLLEILDRCDADLALCTDFGNFKGDTKYDDLAAVLPFATTVHAKADYEGGALMTEGFSLCMTLSRSAGFEGPYVLIFSDKGDEWSHLHALKDEIITHL